MHRVWHCCKNRFTEALSCFTIVVCCHALLCFTVLYCQLPRIVVFLCCVLPLIVVGAVALLWDRPWGSRVQHCVALLCCFNTVLYCCVVATLCCTVPLLRIERVLAQAAPRLRPWSNAFHWTRFPSWSQTVFFMLKKKYRNWVRNINIIGIKLSDNDNDVSNPPFGPFDCQLYTCHWSAENESFFISFIVCFCVTNCDPSDCFKWDPLT